MSRQRTSSFKEEIASVEAAISKAKQASVKPVVAAAPKKAIDDAQIKQEAVKIKDEDNSVLMNQIKALETSIMSEDVKEEPTEVKADQNDDAMNNNPLKGDDAEMGDDEFDLTADDEEWMDDDGDDDEDDEDDENLDEVEASVKASDEDMKEDDKLAGVEDQISNTHDQVIDEVKPEDKGEQPIDVVKHAPVVASKNKVAMIKEATARLDRLANYLEKKGKKSLAFRLDRISDALESKIK